MCVNTDFPVCVGTPTCARTASRLRSRLATSVPPTSSPAPTCPPPSSPFLSPPSLFPPPPHLPPLAPPPPLPSFPLRHLPPPPSLCLRSPSLSLSLSLSLCLSHKHTHKAERRQRRSVGWWEWWGDPWAWRRARPLVPLWGPMSGRSGESGRFATLMRDSRPLKSISKVAAALCPYM